MNLVAKEGPMVNRTDGVLVLSKTAGAYEDLAEACIGIEPHDVEGTAQALYDALMMSWPERRQRAERLKALITSRDLRAWFRRLLDDIDDNAPLPASSAA
jgi:trehalose 6-phosphate synthase